MSLPTHRDDTPIGSFGPSPLLAVEHIRDLRRAAARDDLLAATRHPRPAAWRAFADRAVATARTGATRLRGSASAPAETCCP